MNYIFVPRNAKLHFAKNFINIYNNFDWKLDYHTGDTFITFDLNT